MTAAMGIRACGNRTVLFGPGGGLGHVCDASSNEPDLRHGSYAYVFFERSFLEEDVGV